MKPPTRSLLACLLVLPTGLSFQASPGLTEKASISTSLKQLGIKEDVEFKADLKDFSGKTYQYYEGKNSYFIFSPSLNSILEYSLDGFSPFHNQEGSLVYGGLNSYYLDVHDEYVSLTDKHSIAKTKVVPFSAYNENKVNKVMPAGSLIDPDIKFNYLTYTVKHPDFFSSFLHEFCGEFDNDNTGKGPCSYVGLGMMIAYAARYKDNTFMDNKYYETDKYGKQIGLKDYKSHPVQDVLGQYLFELNPSQAAFSTTMKDTLNKYAKERGKQIEYVDRWVPFFTDWLISDWIKKDCPMELFGTYPSEKDANAHAVVCYEISIADTTEPAYTYYTIHLGWSGRSKAVVSEAIIGSIYSFDLK